MSLHYWTLGFIWIVLSLFPTLITILSMKYRLRASILEQKNVLDWLLEAPFQISPKLELCKHNYVQTSSYCFKR